jgi:hypothetical protein
MTDENKKEDGKAIGRLTILSSARTTTISRLRRRRRRYDGKRLLLNATSTIGFGALI